MTKGGNNYDHACLFDETSKIAQEIYEKYKECGSTLKVAKEYNCGVNTINSLLEKIDKNWKRFTTVGKASPKIFSEEECIAIYEEYKEVGRINILAEKYNVSRCTISSLLKELERAAFRAALFFNFSILQTHNSFFSFCDSSLIKEVARVKPSNFPLIL